MYLLDTILERLALISVVDFIDILLVTLIIFGVLMLTRAVQVKVRIAARVFYFTPTNPHSSPSHHIPAIVILH